MYKIFKRTNGEIVAVDEKTIRGARVKGASKGIHLVNAWACNHNLSIGFVKVKDKSNEIPAISKLLTLLNITKCTITIDAIGCQKKIAQQIVEGGGNYVLCVKNNRKLLKNLIIGFF